MFFRAPRLLRFVSVSRPVIVLPSRGYSFVEVLVSLLILGVALIGMIGVFPQGIRQVTQSGRTSTINHLAQQKLDQLRASNFSHPDLTDGNHLLTHDDDATIPPGYSISWNVTTGVPLVNMKAVRVEIGYRTLDDDGNALSSNEPNKLSVRFQTYLTP